MKAFLVGLIFLLAVSVLAGIGTLLFPLIIVMHFLLQILLGLFFVLFSIWILGKFIIFVWESIFRSKGGQEGRNENK